MIQEEKLQDMAVIPGEYVSERNGRGTKSSRHLISVLCACRETSITEQSSVDSAVREHSPAAEEGELAVKFK